jgi:hypothetical protein
LKRLAAKFGVSLRSVHEMPLLTTQPLHRNSLTLTAYLNSLLQSVRDGGAAASTSDSSGDEPSLNLKGSRFRRVFPDMKLKFNQRDVI